MTDITLAGTSTADCSGDWRDAAACLTEDPELFFPIGNTGPALVQIDKAKAVCARCDVAETCLRWALDTGQDAGVWGGLAEDERSALKRRNARARAKSFAKPQTVREPRGKFVPAEPYRAIITDARDRGWSARQMAEVIGCYSQTCTDLLNDRSQTVTEMTARRIDAADLSGPPPAEPEVPGTPKPAREPRDPLVPAVATWAILNAARERGWTVKQMAQAIGGYPNWVSDILSRRGENVIHESTVLKVAAADLSGPPPAPVDAPETAVRC